MVGSSQKNSFEVDADEPIDELREETDFGKSTGLCSALSHRL